MHSITRSEHKYFPGLFKGNQVVKMTLTKDIPGSVRIAGFECRVWYRRQPAYCPLDGLCRRCRHPGHMAKECRNAWGRPASEATPSASDAAAPASPPSTFADTSADDDPADADFNPDAEFESEDSSKMEAEFLSGDEQVVVTAPNPSRSPRCLRKCKRSVVVLVLMIWMSMKSMQKSVFSVLFVRCGQINLPGRRFGRTSSVLGAE